MVEIVFREILYRAIFGCARLLDILGALHECFEYSFDYYVYRLFECADLRRLIDLLEVLRKEIVHGLEVTFAHPDLVGIQAAVDDVADKDIDRLGVGISEPVGNTVGQEFSRTSDDTRTPCILDVSSYISDLIGESYDTSFECRRCRSVFLGLIRDLGLGLIAKRL